MQQQWRIHTPTYSSDNICGCRRLCFSVCVSVVIQFRMAFVAAPQAMEAKHSNRRAAGATIKQIVQLETLSTLLLPRNHTYAHTHNTCTTTTVTHAAGQLISWLSRRLVGSKFLLIFLLLLSLLLLGVALREFVDRMTLPLQLPLHWRTLCCCYICCCFISSFPEMFSLAVLLTCNCCRRSKALAMLIRFSGGRGRATVLWLPCCFIVVFIYILLPLILSLFAFIFVCI